MGPRIVDTIVQNSEVSNDDIVEYGDLPIRGKCSQEGLNYTVRAGNILGMKIGAFEIAEPVPELVHPHALAMIKPWVDVGSVGSLTLCHMEKHFGVQELGRLARPGNYFDFTRYRPTIGTVDGKRQVTIPNAVINYAQPEGGPDFIFLHLLEPHARGEEYTDSVVELFKYFGVNRYCRLGAMYDAVPHTRPILVTGTTGSIVPREGHTIPIQERKSQYQGPTTIMNLITDATTELGIDVVNFMVHLPQYLQLEEDFSGVARMIEVMSSIYDISAELALFEKGQRQYKELDTAADRNEELRSLIGQLESYYDSQTVHLGEPQSPLSPEIERFLEELDKGLDPPQT